MHRVLLWLYIVEGYILGKFLGHCSPNSGYATFVGCFADSRERVLPEYVPLMSVTVEACLSECANRGWSHAGLEAGNMCWCGNHNFNKYGSASGCDLPCQGNPQESCGGYWCIAVYTCTEVAPPVASNPFTYNGCYDKRGYEKSGSSFHPVTLQSSTTIEGCMLECKFRNHKYAGLEASSKCWCGDAQVNMDERESLKPTYHQSSCNSGCNGNANQVCGGGEALSLYSAGHSNSKPISPEGYIGCYDNTLLNQPSNPNPDDFRSPSEPKNYKSQSAYNGFDSPLERDKNSGPKKVQSNGQSYMKFDKMKNVTVSNCIRLCKNENYQFAGLENGANCWCGNIDLSRRKRDTKKSDEPIESDICLMRCKGNAAQICGGRKALSLFHTGRGKDGYRESRTNQAAEIEKLLSTDGYDSHAKPDKLQGMETAYHVHKFSTDERRNNFIDEQNVSPNKGLNKLAESITNFFLSNKHDHQTPKLADILGDDLTKKLDEKQKGLYSGLVSNTHPKPQEEQFRQSFEKIAKPGLYGGLLRRTIQENLALQNIPRRLKRDGECGDDCSKRLEILQAITPQWKQNNENNNKLLEQLKQQFLATNPPPPMPSSPENGPAPPLLKLFQVFNQPIVPRPQNSLPFNVPQSPLFGYQAMNPPPSFQPNFPQVTNSLTPMQSRMQSPIQDNYALMQLMKFLLKNSNGQDMSNRRPWPTNPNTNFMQQGLPLGIGNDVDISEDYQCE